MSVEHSGIDPSNQPGWVSSASRLESRSDKSIFTEAAEAIQRGIATYGHPQENFDRIACMWSVILDKGITTQQVAQCMVAFKLCRLVGDPTHRDSIVDIAGYARTMEMLSE